MTDKAACPGKEICRSFLSPFDKGSYFKRFLSFQVTFWEKEKARWFYTQRKSQKRKGKVKVWRKKEVSKEEILNEKPLYDWKALSYEIKVLTNLNMEVYLSFFVDLETDSEEEIFELMPEKANENQEIDDKGIDDNLALWDQERSFLEQNLDELSLLPLPMQNLMKQRLREVYGPGFGPG